MSIALTRRYLHWPLRSSKQQPHAPAIARKNSRAVRKAWCRPHPPRRARRRAVPVVMGTGVVKREVPAARRHALQ